MNVNPPSGAAHSTAPLVSICVPTYNGEAYLAECLDCISAQTLGDFEVIILDDASADRSFEIALDYARRDARFRVQRNPQRLGLVGNWNRCLELSRGQWLKPLFQDDLLDARCLERLVKACEKFQQRFGFCHRHIIFDGQASVITQEFFASHQELLREFYGGQDSYMAAANYTRMAVQRPDRNLVGEPTAAIFHRSVLEEYGKFTPTMIQTCDTEYWTRLASNLGVVHVAERLATFRVHDKSTTSHNLSKRNYATRVLDPLIAHYLFLHEPYYGNLRQELFRTSGRLVNWWRLIWAAHQAWKTAVTTPQHPELLAQWHAVAEVYPRLKPLAFIGRFFTKIRALIAFIGLKPPQKTNGTNA